MKKFFIISFICLIFASCTNEALPDGRFRLYNGSSAVLNYSVNNEAYTLDVNSEVFISSKPELNLAESQYVSKTVPSYVTSNATYYSYEISTKPLLTYTFNILYSKSFYYYNGEDKITVEYPEDGTGNKSTSIEISSYSTQTVEVYETESDFTPEENKIAFFGFSENFVNKESDYTYQLYN